MKVAFYEASPSDQAYLRAALSDAHEAVFCPDKLADGNLALAADADILSIFIYSKVNQDVVLAMPQEIDPASTETFTGLGQGLGLIYRDNVVFTPHIGYYSVEALQRILDVTIANIHAFAEGTILHPIVRERRQ